MDDISSSTSTPKRRASEPQPTEALALISNRLHNYQRVPPPLPYLPSDYVPSPDSPRQYIIPETTAPNVHNNALFFRNANSDNNQGSNSKRQRAHSIDYPLANEPNSALTYNSVSSNYGSNVISTRRNHLELVPYREWTVIARNNQKGQLVLYNEDSQSITLRNYVPDQFSNMPSIPLEVTEEEFCPYCHQRLHHTPGTTPLETDGPDYMDRNYFRLLASSSTQISPTPSRADTTYTTYSSTDEGIMDNHQQQQQQQQQELPSLFDNQNLNANAFNQGYYAKFFDEINKLGKGFRGSVFLCEHRLDGVKLGKYAVKKVAIGNNHPWLVRMLREVHLLERLRHPNIVSYKHSWLEYARLTQFGPEVPCLFILMECANGGNLEEYFERDTAETKDNSSNRSTNNGEEQQSSLGNPTTAGETTQKKKMSAKELKRERIRRQYREQETFEQEQTNISEPITHVERRLLTLQEIWSLFLDIVQGLAHLHQQNIVHRDLKPPNLLLQYDTRRNRHGRRGIPRVLISDFGECEDLDETRVDNNRTGATGTLEFMAPEHVRLDPRGRNTVDYSPKADMWSLGMVLYFLCYSRLPYNVIDDVDILREEILAFNEIHFPASRYDIYKDNPTLYAEALNDPKITTDVPKEIKQLIRMLLSLDPIKRPSCNEILSKIQSFRGNESTLSSIFEQSNIPNRWKPMTARRPAQPPRPSATTTVPVASPTVSPPSITLSPYVLYQPNNPTTAFTSPMHAGPSLKQLQDNRPNDFHSMEPSRMSSQNMDVDKAEVVTNEDFELIYNNSNSKRAHNYRHYPPSKAAPVNPSMELLQSEDDTRMGRYASSSCYNHGNDAISLSLRKRQRVSESPNIMPDDDSMNEDIMMEEREANQDMNVTSCLNREDKGNSSAIKLADGSDNDPSTSFTRLLLDSPPPPPTTDAVFRVKWLSDRQTKQLIKTITAVLKIASCTYPCSPYSANPLILYPTIFFATLDFWCESSSPSFILLLLHVVWILAATLLSTSGMCVA